MRKSFQGVFKMSEEDFKTEMLKRGWNEEEIQEFVDRANEPVSLPLEHWLQDKPKIRNYYINKDGNIVDSET